MSNFDFYVPTVKFILVKFCTRFAKGFRKDSGFDAACVCRVNEINGNKRKKWRKEEGILIRSRAETLVYKMKEKNDGKTAFELLSFSSFSIRSWVQSCIQFSNVTQRITTNTRGAFRNEDTLTNVRTNISVFTDTTQRSYNSLYFFSL